jgi:hypothetical protein
VFTHFPRQAEVAQTHIAIPREENILTLDVAVHHILLVAVRYHAHKLHRNAQAYSFRDTLTASCHAGYEAAGVHFTVLHDNGHIQLGSGVHPTPSEVDEVLVVVHHAWVAQGP